MMQGGNAQELLGTIREDKNLCSPPGLDEVEYNPSIERGKEGSSEIGGASRRPLPSLGSFDGDIIEWMKRNKKYCLEIQKQLDEFVSDYFAYTSSLHRSQAVITEVYDNFKRKLIHKLCERYCIERTVEAKKGQVLLSKTLQTKM